MSFINEKDSKARQHEGFLKSLQIDVIKWEPGGDGEKEFAHRYEYEDFPNGSQLILAPSQMAVFVNNSFAGDVNNPEAGEAQYVTFTGPCRITLETRDSRFAPFRYLVNSLTGGVSAFHSTVYFIDTTYMTDLSWGTVSPIGIVDPVEEVNVHVRAFGVFGAHIERRDEAAAECVKRFMERVVGTSSAYTKDDLVRFMRAKILEYVPNLLAEKMLNEGIGVLTINAKLTELSKTIYEKLVPCFAEIGLTLDNFSFHSINVPDEDLAEINEMKKARKRAQFEAEGNAIRMDIESEAKVRMREREGYSYAQEKNFEILNNAASNEGAAGAVIGSGIGLGVGAGIGSYIGREMSDINADTKPDMNGGNSINCKACGQKLPAGAKFCYMCGERTGAAKCGKCGAALLPGAKFCLECGAPVNS